MIITKGIYSQKKYLLSETSKIARTAPEAHVDQETDFISFPHSWKAYNKGVKYIGSVDACTELD